MEGKENRLAWPAKLWHPSEASHESRSHHRYHRAGWLLPGGDSLQPGGSLLETKSHVSYGLRVGYFAPGDAADLATRIDEIWREISLNLDLSLNLRKSIFGMATPRRPMLLMTSQRNVAAIF